MNAFCTGCSVSAPIPSTVVIDSPGDGLGRRQAADDRHAVEQHRACAADAGAAHEFRAGQRKIVAQHVGQKRIWIVWQFGWTAVDGDAAHDRPHFRLRDCFRAEDFLDLVEGDAAAITAPVTISRTTRVRSSRKLGLELQVIDAAHRDLDRAGKIGRAHPLAQRQAPLAADAIDRALVKLHVLVLEALDQIAGLRSAARTKALPAARFPEGTR